MVVIHSLIWTSKLFYVFFFTFFFFFFKPYKHLISCYKNGDTSISTISVSIHKNMQFKDSASSFHRMHKMSSV